MPQAPTTTHEFLTLIRKSGILAPEKLAGGFDSALPEDPHQAAALLVAEGVVTKFQALQLLAGRHKGFRIGTYRILDLLGRGGMGAVYLAEHLALQRKVALKILVPGKDDDQKLALERFLREARSVAALDHPNIVRIFDVASHNSVPYLVMEYVEGETLQHLIDTRGAIPYSLAVYYVAQAAAGLQHAYEKGLVHRDIKPGNLIRDKSETIKILDMGLARSSSSADMLTAQMDNGAVVGTADFIAPEQALNNPIVDIRADIYSLGATFFSLVIGKPPFMGNTTQKLLQHQLRSAPSLLSCDATLPAELSQVVAKMLAKKPEERFQTPAEVIAALSPWLANNTLIPVGWTGAKPAEFETLKTPRSFTGRTHSGLQLPTAGEMSELGQFQGSEAEMDTGAMAASITSRDAKRTSPVPSTKRRSIWVLVGGLFLAVVAGLSLASWLVHNRESIPDKEETQAKPETPAQQESASETARGDVALAVKPSEAKLADPLPPPVERVLYQFDAAQQLPFRIRQGMVLDLKDPNKKLVKIISQTGPGEPPARWKARCWNVDSEMDYFVESVDGKNALGIHNDRAPASAMLFTPPFDCQTSLCRLKFEYQAPLKDRKFVVKFKPADTRLAWEVATPPITVNNVWRVEDLTVDLKGARSGYFEFHNSDPNPRAPLRLHSLTITELKSTGAEVP
jgi:serine/threonine protein kinase